MKCPFCIKVCKKCKDRIGEARILVAYTGNFARNKKGKYGLQSKCKEYIRERDREYRQANKEQIREYYQTNKEHIKERNREYRQANKEYIRERDREYQREYRQANPEKNFNKKQRRRMKEQNQGRDITKEEYKEINAFFGWRCAYSGESLKKGERSLDHVIPLHLGGTNMPYNLVPMKKNYNSSKQTQEMEEWYRKQPFFSEERLSKIYEWIEYASQKYSE